MNGAAWTISPAVIVQRTPPPFWLVRVINKDNITRSLTYLLGNFIRRYNSHTIPTYLFVPNQLNGGLATRRAFLQCTLASLVDCTVA
eukprot:COSAG01_NODE_5042_length_4524_cov_2.550113_2_plen_87_part_00